MTDRETVKEFAKIATDYGVSSYQHQQMLEYVKRQKSTLANLRRWEKKPETRKVSAHTLELLRREILETQERIRGDTKDAKTFGRQVARLKHALEVKTRQLVTAE